MGRVGKVLFDLLRFQVPVIDDAVSLLTVVVLVVVFAVALLWPLWHLIARPIAVACGMIPMTSYDYVVRGWKAERREDWAAALRAYDEALSLNRGDPEVHSRREKLLEEHHELLGR